MAVCDRRTLALDLDSLMKQAQSLVIENEIISLAAERVHDRYFP
jgi:hypothetical protein